MEKRYRLLRLVSHVVRVFAWVVFVFCEVFGVIALFAGGATPPGIPIAPGQPQLPAWAAGLILMLLGPLYFSMIYALGGIIRVLLDIEDHTRRSAEKP